MAEALKTIFNAGIVAAMADHLARHAPGFDRDGFVAHVCDGLETLELKQRSTRITDALVRFFPADFPDSARILARSLHPTGQTTDAEGIAGWPIMPMADYVALRGLGHVELALDLLGEMTKRLTAEFAIRPFLLAHPEPTLARMRVWARDANPHLRRLVSEGARPRLPWGMRLRPFIEDPGPVIDLIEPLRDDPSDYVRRSVANNLNDIAKDHPDLVARIAADWLRDASPERRRLVTHACRTLIKQGHPATLQVLGFGRPSVRASLTAAPEVRFGEALALEIDLTSETTSSQRIVLDYAIHHVKANGTTTPKVFKWQTLTLGPGETRRLSRKHAIRPITTRRYHDGVHAVEILANGVSLARAEFLLTGTGQRVGTGTSPR